MMTCPVCRLDISETVARCPDCDTILNDEDTDYDAADVDSTSTEHAEPPPLPTVGDRLLHRFTVTRDLGRGRVIVEFEPDATINGETAAKTRRAVATIIREGRGTNPLTLAGTRDWLTAHPHPSLEPIVAAKVDDQGRGIIVAEIVPGRSLARLIAPSDGDNETIPETVLPRLAHDLATALELLHRRSPHGALSGETIRIAPSGRPVIVDVLANMLRRPGDATPLEDEQERRRETLTLARLLLSLFDRITNTASSKKITDARATIATFVDEAHAADPYKAPSSGVLVSRLGPFAPARRPEEPTRRRFDQQKNAGRERDSVPGPGNALGAQTSPIPVQAALKPNDQHVIDPPRMRLPEDQAPSHLSVGVGANLHLTPFKREPLRFIPEGYVEDQRRRSEQEAERRVLRDTPTANAAQREQLAFDLWLLHTTAWTAAALAHRDILPAFVIRDALIVLALTGAASLVRRSALPGYVFVLFGLINLGAIPLVAPSGYGLSLATLLSGLTLWLANTVAEASIGWGAAGPPQLSPPGYEPAIDPVEKRRVELSKTLDRLRAYTVGGVALAIAWLPGAMTLSFTGVLLARAFLVGALAVFLALRKGFLSDTDPSSGLVRNLIIGGAFCATAHLADPLTLAIGLLLTLVTAVLMRELLHSGALGEDALTPPRQLENQGPYLWKGKIHGGLGT